MVLWLGGPQAAMLTCLAAVGVAFLAGEGVEWALRLIRRGASA
jgi:hypothetical protein